MRTPVESLPRRPRSSRNPRLIGRLTISKRPPALIPGHGASIERQLLGETPASAGVYSRKARRGATAVLWFPRLLTLAVLLDHRRDISPQLKFLNILHLLKLVDPVLNHRARIGPMEALQVARQAPDVLRAIERHPGLLRRRPLRSTPSRVARSRLFLGSPVRPLDRLAFEVRPFAFARPAAVVGAPIAPNFSRDRQQVNARAINFHLEER
jgi:hypothetical protein